MSFLLARLGRIFFAISIGVFGIQDLMQGKWNGGIPPVPPWTPGGHMFVYITGAILVAISISLLLNKEARLSATILGLICVLCVLFVHTQRFHDIIHDGNARTRAFEAFALGGAAFILAALAKSSSIQFLSSANPVLAVIGRYIYAFSMIIFGVQHFLYAQFIAFLIPKWMPAHLFLAYFTGTAFIAAGLAIAIHYFSRLASVLLGLMFLLWVVSLHAARVFAHPHNADELTSLFVALAFSDASLVLAAYSPKKLLSS